MSTAVREAREVSIRMNDLLKVLTDAKEKIIFRTQEDFIDVLDEVKQSDISLDLDWDNEAGEEWARFIHCELGKVYMLNSKIGIIFTRNSYSDKIPSVLYSKYKILLVDNFDEKEWHIDLEAMKKTVPQIIWHSSEDAVNPKMLSLDDFYYATI